MSKISIENITKRFGEHTLFEHFFYQFEEGKLYGIIGESGSGKSTLLHMIGGLEKPDEGSILYNNKFSIQNNKEVRNIWKTEVAFIFQNYALVDSETVKQNLIVPLNVQKEKERDIKIANALKTVGLDGFENKKISTLSGGEQQRVALARVLLKRCEVILADEPTGNLDEHNKKIVFDILKSLTSSGKTVILVTHDATLANSCDHRIRL